MRMKKEIESIWWGGQAIQTAKKILFSCLWYSKENHYIAILVVVRHQFFLNKTQFTMKHKHASCNITFFPKKESVNWKKIESRFSSFSLSPSLSLYLSFSPFLYFSSSFSILLVEENREWRKNWFHFDWSMMVGRQDNLLDGSPIQTLLVCFKLDSILPTFLFSFSNPNTFRLSCFSVVNSL